jgi:hypothetical protein
LAPTQHTPRSSSLVRRPAAPPQPPHHAVRTELTQAQTQQQHEGQRADAERSRELPVREAWCAGRSRRDPLSPFTLRTSVAWCRIPHGMACGRGRCASCTKGDDDSYGEATCPCSSRRHAPHASLPAIPPTLRTLPAHCRGCSAMRECQAGSNQHARSIKHNLGALRNHDPLRNR